MKPPPATPLDREGRARAVWLALADAAGSDGVARITPRELRRDVAEKVGDIGLDHVFEGLLVLHDDGSVASIPLAQGGGYRLNYEGQAARTPAPVWTAKPKPEELLSMAARKKKGSEKRAGKVDDGSGIVRQKLTDQEWRARCDDLASALKKHEDIESRKAVANQKYNAELRQLDEQISVLADEVDTKHANVAAQADMFDAKGKAKDRPENDAVANDGVENETAENDAVAEGA